MHLENYIMQERRMRRKIRVTSNLEVRDEKLEVRVKSDL